MPRSVSRDRIVSLLEHAKDQRIAVIGDAMLDVYLRGDVERISPEAPVPVVHVRERRYALGGAANVAQNVVAMGATCRLVAAVGDDAAGAQLRTMLGIIGVGPEGLLTVARPTTRKTRVVARSQQLVRIDDEDASDLSSADSGRIGAALEAALGDAHALILEDYNKGVL